METIENNSISIILWVIVAAISIRHLYVNWRTFKWLHRTIVLISMVIMLPLLLLSPWSDTALILFMFFSFVVSYVKIYKSRIERSSLQNKIDDKYLISSYPKFKDEKMSSYRTRVYMWYLLNYMMALALVIVLGGVLSHLEVIILLVKSVF